VAEQPTRETLELASAREAIELSEARRGTHMQAEVGLPDGFVPPSAALASPRVESITAQAASGAASTQAAEQER
jgi:hypothetical protein